MIEKIEDHIIDHEILSIKNVQQNDARYVKTETDPLSLHLDQTTPQTVTTGIPIFSAGVQTPTLLLKNTSAATFARVNTSNELTLKNVVSVSQGATGYAYPPAQNSTYVKATTEYDGNYAAYKPTDPLNSLTGDTANAQWYPTSGIYANQRFHIDLGASKLIDQIYYENSHYFGSYTNQGIKNFTLWGSNSAAAFADLDFTHDTDWVQLTTDSSVFLEHAANGNPDPQYISITTSTSYRYYAFKMIDNYGYVGLFGIRRLVLRAVGVYAPSEGTYIDIKDSSTAYSVGTAKFGASDGETILDGVTVKLNLAGAAPSNGFVKTGSSTGLISIDTNAYAIDPGTAAGGSGSAGAGNQYIVIKVGGVSYKVLHDGTI